MKKLISDSLTLIILLLVVFIGAVFCYTPRITLHQDFIQYWSAWHAFKKGLNPYDPSTMYLFQQNAGLAERAPRMFWCPPWALLFMQPIVSVSQLAVSQIYWMKCCLIIFGASVTLIYQYLKRFTTNTFQKVIILGFGFLQAPIGDIVNSGQISIVLLGALLLSLYLLEIKKPFYAGVALSVLTIKPHLFFLIWIYILWSLISKKEWRVPLGMLCGLSILIVSSEIVLPNSVYLWVQTFTFSETDSLAVPRASWIIATLPAILRLLTSNHTPLFSVLIPGIFGILLWWDLMKKTISISLQGAIIVLLPLSLVLAPYGWFYDQIVLLPLSMIICLSILQLSDDLFKSIMGLSYLGVTLGSLVFYLYLAQWQHQLWWVSMAYACLALVIWRSSKPTLLYLIAKN